MNTRKELLCWALALALPLAAVGCAKEGAETDSEDVTTTTSEHEQPGVAATSSDVSPVTAEMAIDDVTVGSGLAPDGSIAADHHEDDFAPGEPIYVAMEVGDVPANSTVKVAWYGEGDNKVGEETKTVAAGTTYLNFQANAKDWPKGDYRVEVWYGDEKTAEEHFQIVDAAKAGT